MTISTYDTPVVVFGKLDHIHEISRPLVIYTSHNNSISGKGFSYRALKTIRFLSLQPLPNFILAQDIFSILSHISIQLVRSSITSRVPRVEVDLLEIILPGDHDAMKIVTSMCNGMEYPLLYTCWPRHHQHHRFHHPHFPHQNHPHRPPPCPYPYAAVCPSVLASLDI